MEQRDNQNLGRWTARPSRDFDPIDVGTVDHLPEPIQAMPVRANAPQTGPTQGPRRRHRGGFWLGLVLGLVPLLLVVAGLTGYLIRGDADGGDTETGVVSESMEPIASAPSSQSTPPVQTTEALEVQTSVSGPSVATGRVAGGIMEVDGTIPGELGSAWSAQVSALAAALGLQFVDRTDAQPDVADGELSIVFPAAVVYLEDSPEEFDGQPHDLFHALADFLENGAAQLTLAAFAEPSRPEDAHLALFRAEHVHEHLVELGVDPSRLAVEIRPLAEAATGPGIVEPVDRRVDLEIRYAA